MVFDTHLQKPCYIASIYMVIFGHALAKTLLYTLYITKCFFFPYSWAYNTMPAEEGGKRGKNPCETLVTGWPPKAKRGGKGGKHALANTFQKKNYVKLFHTRKIRIKFLQHYR